SSSGIACLARCAGRGGATVPLCSAATARPRTSAVPRATGTTAAARSTKPLTRPSASGRRRVERAQATMTDPPFTLVDTAYLTVYAPTTRPLSFLGIEIVVLGCGALTLLHALRARREGDPGALFAWVSILLYGVCLEIASYNAFPSFRHGQFTVMFYHRKLPLYITAVYPVLLYTGQRTVRRLRLSRLVEPLVVGFMIVMIDLPYDVIGPDAGWWAWDGRDPNVLERWHGVPVTSYYWHLTWGAILSALCRWAEPRMKSL